MSGTKVYEILADTFRHENVDTCFALLGDANMNWATALAMRGCGFIYVRHEHCAVSAAMTWSRATGEVGVATVTCGPGITQILTALPAAVRARIPLVIFAGEAPLKAAWYNQAIEQQPFVNACGAAYQRLHHPDTMPIRIRDAFLQARTECRPVVVGVPFDLQQLLWNGSSSLPVPSRQMMPKQGPLPPNPEDLARAADVVNSAKKIVVMAGIGAVHAGAGPACRALAERVGGLLATTLPARGLFHNDPFSLGVAGGFSSEVTRECLGNADLIVSAGMSLASHNSDAGSLFPASRVLHVDIAPAAVSQGRVAAQFHFRADARLGIEALLTSIEPADMSTRQWRSEDLARRIRDTPADSAVFPVEAGLLDPRDVVRALDDVLPLDWEMVNSSGHCSFYFSHMPQRPVERFHTIREYGAIGNGISYAMGVATARPDRTVVLFDGDGSLLMHIQELETILRHQMNILICVMNDGAYGSEIHKLRAEGLPDDGGVFGRTDLGRVARGFGLGGLVVQDLSGLPGKLERFRSEGIAAVWDFHISDRVVSPVVRRSHRLKQTTMKT